MDNAKFFECGVSVLDMVYDTLVGDKTVSTLYRTSINGAPTNILVSEFLDSTVAVGKRQNLSFMAGMAGGNVHLYYNRTRDMVTKDITPKGMSSWLLDEGTVKLIFPTSKQSFIEKLTQTVLA